MHCRLRKICRLPSCMRGFAKSLAFSFNSCCSQLLENEMPQMVVAAVEERLARPLTHELKTRKVACGPRE